LPWPTHNLRSPCLTVENTTQNIGGAKAICTTGVYIVVAGATDLKIGLCGQPLSTLSLNDPYCYPFKLAAVVLWMLVALFGKVEQRGKGCLEPRQ